MDPGTSARLRLSLAVAAAYIAVPAATVIQAWLAPARDPGIVAVDTLVAAFLFVAGNWSWAGYGTRWLYPIALSTAAWHSQHESGLAWALGILLAASAATSLASLLPLRRAHELRLQAPFAAGVYYVAHGGPGGWLNHHHTAGSQRHALDVVRLGPALTRARGLYPAQPAAYRIWDTPVLSPCDGVVTAAVGDQPDFDPPQRDRARPAGNFVMIRCGPELYVGVAHLRRGSLEVRDGDVVRAGQVLGHVGNSGNTTEPHLHLQAKRGGSAESLLDGEGVPLRIDGRRLRRNGLIWAHTHATQSHPALAGA